MILKGSQRGGAKQLADHLNNIADNEHVELHEVRGFIADTLEEALQESYAISRGTNCTQHMFSLSLNPPPSKDVPVSVFEDALERIEVGLGLSGQPRIVVFHEKEGRRHAHCVWSRINPETMTAVNLPFYKTKLKNISREIFIEQKWKMPKGLMNSEERTSNQFTLDELHQSKRAKRDPNELKKIFQDCWAISDTKQSFENAIKEHGFLLAHGDQRCFVAIGLQGQVYSLSRMTRIKTLELEDRLGDPSKLPNVEKRLADISRKFKDITKRNIKDAEEGNARAKKELEDKRNAMVEKHRRQREDLKASQQTRLLQERQQRQKQFAYGLKGLWNRLNGKHAQLVQSHKLEDNKSIRRDLKEFQALRFRQLEERRRLQTFIESFRKSHSEDISSALLLSSREETQDSAIVKKIRRNPECILPLLADKNSIFTRSDIARELRAYIPKREENHEAMATIMASAKLVELYASDGKHHSTPCYSTREMIDLESRLMQDSIQMIKTGDFGMPASLVNKAIKREDIELQKTAGVSLSNEQKQAIKHITGNEQISCVIGVAGAGKSTLLAAALAGKAAKELELSSGIKSSTLTSYEFAWDKNSHELQKGDILVIDEAGMISSKQMARFVNEAKEKGAKICLIGDPEQLQPINAGAPFRNISEKIGYAALHEVHRQKSEWQREASMAFAKGEVETALQAYRDHNAIEVYEDNDDEILNLAHDYMNDFIANSENTTRLALAHRRADVKALNETIREMRKACDELQDEKSYKTEHGVKAFAAGDRLLFTKNDNELGVKNGTLGTVIKTKKNILTIALDREKKSEPSSKVTIHMNDYNSITHGYAQTIHKSQGATVDNSYILASRTLDRQLSYVSFTRHKENVNLYVDREEFKSFESLCKGMERDRQKQSTLDFQEHWDKRTSIENLLEIEMEP